MSQEKLTNKKFTADIMLLSKHNYEEFNDTQIKVLQASKEMCLFEFNNKRYNIRSAYSDIVKTRFVYDDILQMVIGLLFLALGILFLSQIVIIFSIKVEPNLTYILVIFSLGFSSALVFFSVSKKTKVFIVLMLIKREEKITKVMNPKTKKLEEKKEVYELWKAF